MGRTVFLVWLHLDAYRRTTMRSIEHIYINGEFVTPHGTELADLITPSDNALLGRVRLGDAKDGERAIAAAKAAFPAWSRTTIAERAA
jgi:aldehyde dehydrogenase (NAD+)